MFRTSNFCLPLAAAVFAICVSAPASAIDCRKGYQRVQGNWIATPYCQDQYLSEVATVYGVSAPAAKLRNNPNFKRNVCRLVGRDIRIQETCNQVNPWGARRGF